VLAKRVMRSLADGVTAIDQFLENDAACLTCGSVENDFQLELPCMGLRVVRINSIQLFRKVKEKSEMSRDLMRYTGLTRAPMITSRPNVVPFRLT
jgi:hypothetical protein